MIKEITIGASHTLNLKNFNSMRVQASITAAIPEELEGDEYIALKAGLQKELRNLLEETFFAQKRKNAQPETEYEGVE